MNKLYRVYLYLRKNVNGVLKAVFYLNIKNKLTLRQEAAAFPSAAVPTSFSIDERQLFETTPTSYASDIARYSFRDVVESSIDATVSAAAADEIGYRVEAIDAFSVSAGLIIAIDGGSFAAYAPSCSRLDASAYTCDAEFCVFCFSEAYQVSADLAAAHSDAMAIDCAASSDFAPMTSPYMADAIDVWLPCETSVDSCILSAATYDGWRFEIADTLTLDLTYNNVAAYPAERARFVVGADFEIGYSECAVLEYAPSCFAYNAPCSAFLKTIGSAPAQIAPSELSWSIKNIIDASVTATLSLATVETKSLEFANIGIDYSPCLDFRISCPTVNELYISPVLEGLIDFKAVPIAEYGGAALRFDAHWVDSIVVSPCIFDTASDQTRCETDVVSAVGARFVYSTLAKLLEYQDSSYVLGAMEASTMAELTYMKHDY